MNKTIEIAITSDENAGPWSCAVWDVRTGTNLMTYKGGGSISQHGLTLIRNEFLISANLTKPLLHVWPINSHEQIQSARFVMPGRVTALSVSPDGHYCVAGIAENIYVWQISSGLMFAALSKHYQTVTTIKFTDDGSHFVSAGQDGIVSFWNLTNVLCRETIPQYTFSDHALPVTDVYVGTGGIRSNLCTVSLDRSCKIYNLSSGVLMLNVVFQAPLTTVIIDQLENNIYVGSKDGAIFEFNISSPPRTKEYHLTKEDCKNKFRGHQGSVTCLSISLDGETLLSGGTDENVLVWHIPSKQLIRTLPHKGKITNAFFTLTPPSMFNQEKKLTLIANNFQRMINSNLDADDHVVETMITNEYEEECEFNLVQDPVENVIIRERKNSVNDNSSEIEILKNEIQKLKKANRELYEYNVKKIILKK